MRVGRGCVWSAAACRRCSFDLRQEHRGLVAAFAGIADHSREKSGGKPRALQTLARRMRRPPEEKHRAFDSCQSLRVVVRLPCSAPHRATVMKMKVVLAVSLLLNLLLGLGLYALRSRPAERAPIAERQPAAERTAASKAQSNVQ